MKKISSALFFFTISWLASYAQMAGKFFQGTLKYGSATNAVKAVIRSSQTFKGKFSNLQFTFQIPDTVSPQPVVNIKNNYQAAYIPTANYSRQVINEGGYYNYLFAAVPTASSEFSFTAGTEIDVFEVEGIGMNGTNVTMKLACLANGGSSGQLNFYIEVSGNDNTNDEAMFYGTGATNGGSYTAYSFVPLTNVILPLQVLNFKVARNNNLATLTWIVQNESVNNSYFEIERSTNGTTFTKIGQLPVINNGADSNVYQYTDATLSSIQNNGLLYYRLKQINKDGKYIYSDVRILHLAFRDGISVFPNPAQQGFYLVMPSFSSSNDKINLHLINTSGQLIDTRQITAAQATNYYFNIQKPGIPFGTYLLKIYKANEYLGHRKIIITR